MRYAIDHILWKGKEIPGLIKESKNKKYLLPKSVLFGNVLHLRQYTKFK